MDHTILIRKFEEFGFDWTCAYLRSYLTKRIQYVECFGHASATFDLTCSGVIQGCFLGPLLFNLKVNNIGAKLQLDQLLYAYDLEIYKVIPLTVLNVSIYKELRNKFKHGAQTKKYFWMFRNVMSYKNSSENNSND